MRMSSKPLVSVIIISYKNYHYIYNAIDSVLSQDYSNIELIISNDGSIDFDKQTIEKYLKKHAKKNIKRIIINNNPKNLGTVKNANIGLKLSKGKYILLFAADDAMYDKTIVTKFVTAFKSLPEKELIVTSQLGMYDDELKKLKELFITNSTKQKIFNLEPKKLFGEIALACIIPSAGTCYKRKIFEKYGYFDEKYILVEDYSSSLKYSRLGIKHNYFDFISFKHRDGGISHGNGNEISKTTKIFDKDIISIMNHEILPYFKLLNDNQKKLVNDMYISRKWDFGFKYKYELGTKKERRQFVLDNYNIFIFNLFKDIYRKIHDNANYLIVAGVILYVMYSLSFNFGKGFISIFKIKEPHVLANNINWYVGFVSFSIIATGILFIIIPAIYKTIKKIFKFLKHIL